MRLLAVAVAALALAGPAAAAECASPADLEDEVVCPVCAPQTLDQSTSPIAVRMKQQIARWSAECKTKDEIKALLVADFGPEVLASPSTSGFNLLAWLLPLLGLALGAAALAAAARRWSSGREAAGPAPADPSSNGRAGAIDPELERRLDEELARFDA